MIVAESEEGLAFVWQAGGKRVPRWLHQLHDGADLFLKVNLQARLLFADLRQMIGRPGLKQMKDLARLSRGRGAEPRRTGRRSGTALVVAWAPPGRRGGQAGLLSGGQSLTGRQPGHRGPVRM